MVTRPKKPISYPDSIPNPDDPNDRLVPAFDTAISSGSGFDRNHKPIYASEKHLNELNKTIRKESPGMIKYATQANHIASLMAKKAVRPDEIAALRRKMFDTVNRSMGDVDEVMKGTKTWSNVQLRLFSLLTERVMPKLTSVSVEDNTGKNMDEMSLEELEAIALGKKKAQAVEAIVKEAEELDQKALEEEEQEAKKEVSRKTVFEIAQMTAMANCQEEWFERLTPKYKGTPKEIKPANSGPRAKLEQAVAEGRITPQEAVAIELQRRQRLREAQNHIWAKKKQDMAVSMGTPLAARIANQYRDYILETKDAFRVHPLKGRKRLETILKRKEREKLADERRERLKEEHSDPLLMIAHRLKDVPEHMKVGKMGIRASDLRVIRPDWFNQQRDPQARERVMAQLREIRDAKFAPMRAKAALEKRK